MYERLRHMMGGQVLLVSPDAKVVGGEVISCEFSAMEVDPDNRSGRTFLKPRLKISTQQ